jgi:adenine deaminase
LNSPNGKDRADLLIRNGLVIDPLRETIEKKDLSVKDGRVLSYGAAPAAHVYDASGLYVAPGFIDSHLHIEGLHLLPEAYCRACLAHGTTTIVTDLHEIANAGGIRGLDWYMRLLDAVPLDVFVMAPSCVPSSRFERGAGRIGMRELRRLRTLPRVIGLGEVMDLEAVLSRKRSVMEKIGLFVGRPVDGHGPGLRGETLTRYLSAGIYSDHETTSLEEAEEKLEKGMHLFLRQGSVAKDLPNLLPVIRSEYLSFLSLCTDDLSARDLFEEGHMDLVVRSMVESGVSLFHALRLASISPAVYFNLADRRYAGIGKKADFVIFEDPKAIRVKATVKDGAILWREGDDIYGAQRGRATLGVDLPMAPLSVDDLRHKVPGATVHAIVVKEGSIITGHREAAARTADGWLAADTRRDILFAAVFDRYRGAKEFGLGFVNGLGLNEGALASTYAHDAHNLVVVGHDPGDILAAREALRQMGGGMAVVRGGKVVESVPMPFYGIISDLGARELLEKERRMQKALEEMGVKLSNPFFQMSFLSLPVIPELRLTTRGLFDVTRRRYVE